MCVVSTSDSSAPTDEVLHELEVLLDGLGSRRALVSVTVETDLEDPVAAVFASRLAADRWFAWEQPDRDGFALAGLGSAHEAVSRGPGRFADLISDCAAVTRDRIANEPAGLPAGAGPVWTGGFAFADDGASTASLVVVPAGAAGAPRALPAAPRLAAPGSRSPRSSRPATITTRSSRGSSAGSPRCATEPLAMLDPYPRGRDDDPQRQPAASLRGDRRRGDRADPRRRAGQGRARAGGRGRRARGARPGAGVRRPARGLRLLLLLLRRLAGGRVHRRQPGAARSAARGASAATVALAGSTRRSADPAVDDHLGEQLLHSAKNRVEHRIVARRIERALAPRSVWVEAEREPSVIKVANIQHLATAVHAQLAEPLSAVELAALMHPTPAVGGEPGTTAPWD